MQPGIGTDRVGPCFLDTDCRRTSTLGEHRLSADMPGLNYPFVFECSGCGAETIVKRPDARDLHVNPDSINAVEIVLQKRGWLRDDIKGLIFCRECAGG